MTEMQKQFEEWFKQAHTENVQKVDGKYVHGATERLWQAWQASRAAVVVKLPDWDCYDTPRQAIEACEERLRDAGVSYE